jgi:hypothetical protein
MNESKIRELFEEIDPEGRIPEGKIDELISVMKDQEEHPLKDGDKVGDATFNTIHEEIKNEPDWRKRASLAAKIISMGLE